MLKLRFLNLFGISVISLVFLFSFALNAFASLGDITLTPSSGELKPGDEFTIKVFIDSTGKNLGAFNLFIDFDSSVFEVVTSKGVDGFEKSSNIDNYIVMANPNDISNGHYRFAGIAADNCVNGSNEELITVYARVLPSANKGTYKLTPRVSELSDNLGNMISSATLNPATINIKTPTGSVDDNNNNTNQGFTYIYRLYNKKTGFHLYTRGQADRDKILNKYPDFVFDDNAPAFSTSLVAKPGFTPIYRLYNTRTGAHLYTRGQADRDKILSKYPDFRDDDKAPAFWALVN